MPGRRFTLNLEETDNGSDGYYEVTVTNAETKTETMPKKKTWSGLSGRLHSAMCSFSFIYLFRLPFLNWEILVLSLFYCRALGSPVCQSCFGFPKETDHWQWFGLITTAEIAIIIIHSSSITNANEFRAIAFFIYLLLLVTVCKYNLFYLETNSTWWISSRVFILEREKTIFKLVFSLLLNTHSPFFFLSLCYI